jgi:2-C-methyl-D-erythritol 4-phosphate cytidylyltransferase
MLITCVVVSNPCSNFGVNRQMMFKYTANNLKKLETLLNEAGFIIRYEKGHFVSGYCMLEDKNVIVINKYYEIESRINSLLEIMAQLQVDEVQLSDASRHFLQNNHLQSVKV